MPFLHNCCRPCWRAADNSSSGGASEEQESNQSIKPPSSMGQADISASQKTDFEALARMASREEKKTMRTDAGRRAQAGDAQNQPAWKSLGDVSGRRTDASAATPKPLGEKPAGTGTSAKPIGSIYAEAVRRGVVEAQAPVLPPVPNSGNWAPLPTSGRTAPLSPDNAPVSGVEEPYQAEAAATPLAAEESAPPAAPEVNAAAGGPVEEDTVRVRQPQAAAREPHKAEETTQVRVRKAQRERAASPAGFTRPGSSNAVIRAIGNALYVLGFQAECRVLMVWRVLRDAGIFLGQLLAWLFGGLFSGVASIFADMVREAKASILRLRLRWGILVVDDGTVSENKQSTGHRIKHAAATLGGIAGLVLPVAALVVLIFTVYSVLSMDYALAVEVDGRVIGYIEDEGVLEDAKSILRSRLRLADDQSWEDWQFSPQLKISNTNNYTSKQQLANEILRGASVDIVEGTGLVVDDELVAVTTEGSRLREYLDEILEENTDPSQPEARVSFVRAVECDPEQNDVFLASSVVDYEEIIEMLSRTVSEEKRYTTQEGESLADIAHKNNILFEVLLVRNPQFDGYEPDYIPEVGTDLLIERAKPYLQVQKAIQVKDTEVIPYTTVEHETEKKALGARAVVQEGMDGLQEVWIDYIYVNGELQNQVVVEEKTRILQQPQEAIIEVGTYDFSNITGEYNPVYMFPVPDSTFSSRGMGGGHRGRDINAPQGTPVYACNAGVVRFAGSHYSYGNYIEIDHPDGLMTLYAHNSQLLVSEGDVVQQGQVIALVGSTGMSTGPHVHLEFQQNGALLNPDDFVTGNYG